MFWERNSCWISYWDRRVVYLKKELSMQQEQHRIVTSLWFRLTSWFLLAVVSIIIPRVTYRVSMRSCSHTLTMLIIIKLITTTIIIIILLLSCHFKWNNNPLLIIPLINSWIWISCRISMFLRINIISIVIITITTLCLIAGKWWSTNLCNHLNSTNHTIIVPLFSSNLWITKQEGRKRDHTQAIRFMCIIREYKINLEGTDEGVNKTQFIYCNILVWYVNQYFN